MNEKTEILIKFESKQDGVANQYFRGELFIKGQTLYIKYVELIEGQEIRHLIRYSSNEMKITRNGAVHAEQLYRLHEKTLGFYDNKMIRLQLEVLTKRLAITDNNKRIVLGIPSKLPFHLNVEYDMFVDGQFTEDFEIKLSIEEANV